jgi:hypothetical protein
VFLYHAAMPDSKDGVKTGACGIWLLWLVTAVVLGSPCLWCSGVVWMMEAPALPYSSMASIQPGMTCDEVRELLGAPKAVNLNEDGSETWVYHRNTWAVFFIYFSPDGVVDEAVHDF